VYKEQKIKVLTLQSINPADLGCMLV